MFLAELQTNRLSATVHEKLVERERVASGNLIEAEIAERQQAQSTEPCVWQCLPSSRTLILFDCRTVQPEG